MPAATGSARTPLDQNDIIDDLKDEINYLKRKIRENKSREETIDNEIDIVEGENKHLKRELEKVKKDLKEARDNLKSFETLENIEMEELEIKQQISLGIIKKLKDELANLQRENKRMETEIELNKDRNEARDKEDISSREEVESLEKEIQHLRAINLEKKDLLTKILEEKDNVLNQLKQTEIENET